MLSKPNAKGSALAITALLSVGSAQAADWSDASIGVRWGNQFAEPYIEEDISKTIFNFTYVSGDKLGQNLFVVDALLSDDNDPAAGGEGAATEIYMFYSRTFSLSAITGKSVSTSLFKDLSLTARLDQGTKNIDLAPQPRRSRFGISADLPVSNGYWTLGLASFQETSHNGYTGKDFSYDLTYVVSTAWSQPMGFGTFSGFLDYIGAKGEDGSGVETKPTTLMRAQYMAGLGNSGVNLGIGYEYWKNKYGNDSSLDASGGSTQGTALVLAEYHF